MQIDPAHLAQAEAHAPVRAPDPRTAELEAEIAKLRKQQIDQAAIHFADTLITTDHKALPAERAQLINLYTQAAQDDAAHPLASGSRVTLLQELTQARPAHALTTELVPNAQLVALTGSTAVDGSSQDYAAERKQALAYAERVNGKKR